MMAPAAAVGGIGRKLLSGLRWNTAGFVAQAVAQFVIGIALARLLGPSVFGTMAMAWVAVTPTFILADAGLGLAFVQREGVGPDEIKFCFWAQSGCGIVLALLLCAASSYIAAFFDAPELETVLIVLSAVIVIRAMGLTAVNLLRRSIDFRRLQIIQLSSFLGSQLLFALPIAFFGGAIWSLVAAAIANCVMTSIGAYAMTRHQLGLTFSRKALRLGTTSTWYLLLNIVNAVLGALPQIVIGRLFGTGALGLYDRSYSLIVAPVDRAAEAVSGVLFSFFARTNQHGAVQHDIFLSCLTIAVFFGLPTAAVIGMHSSLIIAVTLGGKWSAAAPLLQPLSMFVLLCLLLQVAVPVLNGRGRPEIEVGVVAAMVGLFLIAVAFAHDDVRDVVWIVVAAHGFRVACLLVSVKFLIGVKMRPILAAILPGLIATGLLLLGNLLLVAALPHSWPDPLVLAAVAIASAAGLLSLWAIYHGWMPHAHVRRAFSVGGAKS